MRRAEKDKLAASVLHVITGLSTGGAERALYNVLAGGLAKSSNVAVLSLLDEGTYGSLIRDLGVPVYTLGMRRGLPGPNALRQLKTIMSDIGPDVVQGWMYHGNLAASLATWIAPGRRARLAWNIRQTLYSLEGEKALTRQVIRANRWVSGNADAIVYNSNVSREQHEHFGFASRVGQLIPNGFNTAELQPDPKRGRIMRAALAISPEATVIGHVARLHPMKDHASFLRAAVAVMWNRPDVVALLVGREVTRDSTILTGIVPPELADRFYFTGERRDVSDLMRAMDVFCQSSCRSEAFPNVLGEAMALGVPCVATNVGDSRDIVGETGQIVPPSDSAALADALATMTERTPAERTSLGGEARARIEARYALPSVVEQYSKLYEQLKESE